MVIGAWHRGQRLTVAYGELVRQRNCRGPRVRLRCERRDISVHRWQAGTHRDRRQRHFSRSFDVAEADLKHAHNTVADGNMRF